VHISFVRSITMDAFKSQEIERMRLGGNKPWRDYFEAAEANVSAGTRSVLPAGRAARVHCIERATLGHGLIMNTPLQLGRRHHCRTLLG
jgi:hypothetical protein